MTGPARPMVGEACTTGEVVLVRHGQGKCNAAGIIGGRRGCQGLSEHGRWQSRRLAERLAPMHAERGFTGLLCSPRLRVHQCAQIIGARLGLPATVVEALAGQEFGVADGQLWEQVTKGFGGTPAHDPDRPIAEQSESWNTYADRMLAALAAILADRAGQRVLLVVHGQTTGLAGGLLSGDPSLDPRTTVRDLVVDHGALSHWCQGPDRWNLLVHNDSRHLRADSDP